MNAGLIVVLLFLNFAISWFNAWGCGKTWNETKAAGGIAHFMNWMGAVMSASGFTWCYLLIAGFLGSVIPFEHKNHVKGPLLTPEMLQPFADLGYLVVILPIIGSGLAIMLHTWGVFWRERNLRNGAAAGWNTFANFSNIYGAARHAPDALSGVSKFFKNDKNDESSKAIVLVLVIGAALGGILTTRAIIKATARSTALNRAFEYEMRREVA